MPVGELLKESLKKPGLCGDSEEPFAITDRQLMSIYRIISGIRRCLND